MSYTLLKETERTAAKFHRCIWCWTHIEVGSRYIDERSVYERSFQMHRWHPECRKAMIQEAKEEGGEIEWIPGRERPTIEGKS